MVEQNLDDAVARVRNLLLVVVPESGLVGVSGDDVHLMVNDGLEVALACEVNTTQFW